MSTLKVNAVTNLAAETPYQPTLMTAQATTSGTYVDFLNIPSWVKRITVMFNGVSTSAASALLVQLGDSGGIENTGYLSTITSAAGTASAYTAGFGVAIPVAASVISGTMTLNLIDSATNSWVVTSAVKIGTTQLYWGAGDKATSSVLTTVRITSVTPDTFDAGSINVMYE